MFDSIYDDDSGIIIGKCDSKMFSNCDRYMHLRIFIDGLSEEGDNNYNALRMARINLKNKYLNAASIHNKNMFQNSFPDAGFDLFSPKKKDCKGGNGSLINKVNLQIRCSAQMICETGRIINTGFHIYPRSSTGSKTPLRLANSIGIIDSGYRGELMAIFDCKDNHFTIEHNDKLLQICAPGLVPIYVSIVDHICDLGEETIRGNGGFGSTNN